MGVTAVPSEWVEAGTTAACAGRETLDAGSTWPIVQTITDVERILTAVVPLIREHIAQQIEANLVTSHRTPPDPYDPNDHYGGVAIHSHVQIVADAARIARGEP